jgi:hypothetical protein
MAGKQRLDCIEVCPADNGFEVHVRFRPANPKKDDPYFGETKKEVYESIDGVLKCVKDQLYKASKDQRIDTLVDAAEPDEESDEEY